MKMEYWKVSRLKFMNIRILVYLLLSIPFFSAFAAFSITFLPEPRSPLTNKADSHFQITMGRTQMQLTRNNFKAMEGGGGRRRKLSHCLGSSPPRCSSKCDKCTPCQPVHVPVPPGTPVTAEYYPEAWRCKCGNRLYMP